MTTRPSGPLPPDSGRRRQHVGTLLVKFGNDDQKGRFLPPTRSREHTWCQGWSEAGAGSDLANLKCATRLDGANYVVNGTELWTSNAHRAHWCTLLTRTYMSESRQDGITSLLVDMTGSADPRSAKARASCSPGAGRVRKKRRRSAC